MNGPVFITEGYLLGATGHRLVPNTDWVNPSGQFYVGFKKGFELFPKQLVERVKDDRAKFFNVSQSIDLRIIIKCFTLLCICMCLCVCVCRSNKRRQRRDFNSHCLSPAMAVVVVVGLLPRRT